jgi:hypothetical protein
MVNFPRRIKGASLNERRYGVSAGAKTLRINECVMLRVSNRAGCRLDSRLSVPWVDHAGRGLSQIIGGACR